MTPRIQSLTYSIKTMKKAQKGQKMAPKEKARIIHFDFKIETVDTSMSH